jgi:hypothetical protein
MHQIIASQSRRQKNQLPTRKSFTISPNHTSCQSPFTQRKNQVASFDLQFQIKHSRTDQRRTRTVVIKIASKPSPPCLIFANPSTSHCAGCKQAAYCSREHQKEIRDPPRPPHISSTSPQLSPERQSVLTRQAIGMAETQESLQNLPDHSFSLNTHLLWTLWLYGLSGKDRVLQPYSLRYWLRRIASVLHLMWSPLHSKP